MLSYISINAALSRKKERISPFYSETKYRSIVKQLYLIYFLRFFLFSIYGGKKNYMRCAQKNNPPLKNLCAFLRQRVEEKGCIYSFLLHTTRLFVCVKLLESILGVLVDYTRVCAVFCGA